MGFPDVPASGEFILNAMEWSGASLETIVRFMGVSKQAASQFVEMLVDRGYLERGQDPSDRRRMTLSLTERGHAAGRAGKAAIEQVDRELEARVGSRAISHTRATLRALLEIKRRNETLDAPDSSRVSTPARERSQGDRSARFGTVVRPATATYASSATESKPRGEP
ncbi:MAG TPA: MarR family transcriptional regulator [Thermoplasmata archaeon]|nr:MarR family transcriptional regulator [Thermoplasmata archaeon]